MDNQVATQPKRTLPSIEDIYGNKVMASKHNELNRLLACEPKKEWLQDHPFATKEVIVDGMKTKVPVEYIPIGIVEYLLTAIYIKWRFEIKEVKVIANSVLTIGRLHVLDPVSGEWDWQDGEGACAIQTKSGQSATDFGNVLTDAVMKAAPASESYAIKDAAEKLGKIFGKDLNRESYSDYKSLDTKFVNAIPAEIVDEINRLQTVAEVADFFASHPDYHLNRDFMKLCSARKTQLDA